MRSLLTFAFAFALALVGCQRLEEEGPSPTSLGEGGGGTGNDDGTTTFTPVATGNDDTGEDDGPGPSSSCDPVAQIGCAAGEKCTAITTSQGPAFTCVGAAGSTLQPYDACEASPDTGLDACPVGYVCLGSEVAGTCVPLCNGDPDCDQGVCAEHPDNAIPHCADDCSPFESLCVGILQCRRADERFACQFPGDADVGGPLAPCSLTNDAGCNESLVCITGALVPGCTEASCCTPVCDATDPDACAAPATCSPVFAAPAPGYETIGACFVPS
jgi:hypothetical protein